MYKKIKLHIILPGGGAKGSYQAGFLYTLSKFFSKCFDIEQVDGVSVGALNGLALCLEEYNFLKKIWFDIKSIKDIFSPHSNMKIMNAYSSYYQMGLNKNYKLKNKIDNLLKKNYNKLKLLNKFNCVVTNLTSSRFEIINGKNRKINEYVTASASPWIITGPSKINNNQYTDGALLKQFPLMNINKTNRGNYYTLIIGVDSKYLANMYDKVGKNLFSYINKVLDVLHTNTNMEDYFKILDFDTHSNNIKVFKYNVDFQALNFTTKNIKNTFNVGKKDALKFILNNVKLKNYYKPSKYLNLFV